MAILTQTVTTELQYETIGKWVLYQHSNLIRLIPKRAFQTRIKKERPIEEVLKWTMRLKVPKSTSPIVIYITQEELDNYKNHPLTASPHDAQDAKWEDAVADLKAGRMERFVGWSIDMDGFLYDVETKRPVPRRIGVDYCWTSACRLKTDDETRAILEAMPQIVEVAEEGDHYRSYKNHLNLIFEISDEEFNATVDEAIGVDNEFWSCRIKEMIFEKYCEHLCSPRTDDDDDEDYSCDSGYYY